MFIHFVFIKLWLYQSIPYRPIGCDNNQKRRRKSWYNINFVSPIKYQVDFEHWLCTSIRKNEQLFAVKSVAFTFERCYRREVSFQRVDFSIVVRNLLRKLLVKLLWINRIRVEAGMHVLIWHVSAWCWCRVRILIDLMNARQNKMW